MEILQFSIWEWSETMSCCQQTVSLDLRFYTWLHTSRVLQHWSKSKLLNEKCRGSNMNFNVWCLQWHSNTLPSQPYLPFMSKLSRFHSLSFSYFYLLCSDPNLVHKNVSLTNAAPIFLETFSPFNTTHIKLALLIHSSTSGYILLIFNVWHLLSLSCLLGDHSSLSIQQP